MKRPGCLRKRWPWLGLLLVPAMAWGLVMAVVPTGWAKDRLVARLAQATGRAVGIGSLKLGVLGDLRIIDLTIAEPSTATDPWLRVAEARIDVHLGQVLGGHCDPGEIEVSGVELRIWRKSDGSTEIGDLLRDRSPRQGIAGHADSHDAAPIALKVSGARVRVVDDPSGTRLDFTKVEAKGTSDRRHVTIDELRGGLNGGKFALAARLDRDPACPRFEVEAQANGVELDRGMPVLGFFVPVVAGTVEGVGGKCDFLIDVTGQGTTRAEVRRSLRGHGSVVLDTIDLEGSKFLAQLDVLGDWPRESRIGAVATDFVVDRGRISTEDLTIQVSRFPFVLGGWTDFDGRFDYAARVDRIAAKLPGDAKGWLAEAKVNFDQLAGLRMRGSIDRIDVTVHGHPLTGDPGQPEDERARFRDTARRIRDRFFR